MSDNVSNMMLEHRKRSQATLEDMARDIRELRQSETHAAVIDLRRDHANDAEVTAQMQVHLDSVRDRIERIERRLDLAS